MNTLTSEIILPPLYSLFYSCRQQAAAFNNVNYTQPEIPGTIDFPQFMPHNQNTLQRLTDPERSDPLRLSHEIAVPLFKGSHTSYHKLLCAPRNQIFTHYFGL